MLRNTWNWSAACGVALLLTGCFATSGDLREIAERVDDYKEGAITGDELSDALTRKADEIEARASDLANSLPTTPAGWLAMVAQIGLAAGAGGVGVNRYRNVQRKKRGEPVDGPATPS